jgi:PAS domain S-box-containing protein
MRLRSAKGREVWTRRAATPFHDDAGLVVGSIVILTDITEAKRAERYRARYELLARHAHDVVMFLRSTDGRILEVNDAAVHTYGHSHAEMLGMTISDLRAPETRAEVPETLRQARGEGRLFQTVHLRKDGTRFPVEISARGTVLEGEEVILSVVRDISARRRAEEEREQIERFRELFIGMLGHDLRNPLSAMLTGTALLLRRGTLSEGDERTVTRIHHSGSRMARMIEQLLDFTRVRVGRGIPIARRPIDLRDLVSHVVDELRAAHPDAAIALSIQGETRGEWDSDRLAQVFSNLIHNAIEHGKGDDPVRVSITGTSGQVEVSVHNRGEPIAPELLPVIFDPFRRDERRGDAKKRGLGLGLYIAQQIVLAHGGIVRVESSREEGTTFDVSLPAARPDR